MLCIHSDISNKPGLTADLSTSTSHASDSELDSVDIKPVIVDAACSENSCLNNYVKPNSKDSGTQGKFVHICHHCGKVGHITKVLSVKIPQTLEEVGEFQKGLY